MSKETKSEQVAIRRAPRLWSFAITGVVLGFLVALALFMTVGQQGPANALGLLTISFASLGGGVGISIAVALDWLFTKKSKRATADRISE